MYTIGEKEYENVFIYTCAQINECNEEKKS